MKFYHRKFKKPKRKLKPIDKSSVAYKHRVYFHGTESEKEEAFVHFSTKGYGCMAVIAMAIGLGLGILFKGFFGFILATSMVCWVLFKFPTVMHCWENVERYNPDLIKYRIDNFK